MAFLESQNSFPSQGEYFDYLSGNAPNPDQVKELTSAPGGGTAGGALGGDGSPEPVTSGTETSAPGTVSDLGPTVSPGQTGDVINRLFSGFETSTPEVKSGILGATTAFGEGAGPSRTYEGIGAEGILGQALPWTQQAGGEWAPQAVTTEQIEAGKGLVGAQYSGPTGLDVNTTAGLNETINRLYNTGQAYSTGAGLYGLVQQAVPGLTAGEARAEAQRLYRDEGFQERVPGYQDEAGYLQESLKAEKERAADFAEQRAKEEADISQRSGEYLTGRRGTIEDELNQAILKARQEQQATIAAYDKAIQSGQLGDLRAIPEGARGFDPESFNTEASGAYEEGTAAAQQLGQQFQDIKHIPFPTLGMNTHGREELMFPEDISPEDRARALERQDAFVQAGFSPRAENYLKPDVSLVNPEEGRFGQMFPLYDFGGDVGTYQPEDFRDYLTPENFESVINRNTMSTERQEQTFNRINELLGEADRLEEDGKTFEAAFVAADVDKFLQDQEANLTARGEALSEAEEGYLAGVRSARKKYKKFAAKKKFTKIARVINTVLAGAGTGGLGSLVYGGARHDSPLSDLLAGIEEKEGSIAYSLSPK